MLEQAVGHDRRQQPWRAAGGKHYEFLEVPLEAVAAFQSAFANGRFFNNHIRNHVSSPSKAAALVMLQRHLGNCNIAALDRERLRCLIERSVLSRR
jgi:hypothetical protein